MRRNLARFLSYCQPYTCLWVWGILFIFNPFVFPQDKKPPDPPPKEKKGDDQEKKGEGNQDDNRAIKRDGSPDVILMNKDDKEMLKAIEKARGTFPGFLKVMKNPGVKQEGFSVKKAFADGKKLELIWVGELTFDGKKLKGVIQNEPLELKNLEIGSSVEIDPKEISDWMYIDDDVLKGGFTIRLIRLRMKPEERKQFDKSFPYKILDE